jgi:predicted transcriptional regulator
MAKPSPYRDPRGHSIRIYHDIYNSHAFNALAPHDVLAYLALLRELKKVNNGDLSLPLTRAKKCGIKHHVTLARSLRALCAVGLIALTRKGGCDRGGRRLVSLYRVTDIECYEMPGKNIEAQKATCDYKKVQSIEQGQGLIKKYEESRKRCINKNPKPSNDSDQVNG